ncbi:hypothetical protein J7410_10110, partial [Xanthomonas phaseoli pv. manihotis]|nr:hypothetical protein [Xanthomonas phaseoli pv. manihotis]
EAGQFEVAAVGQIKSAGDITASRTRHRDIPSDLATFLYWISAQVAEPAVLRHLVPSAPLR